MHNYFVPTFRRLFPQDASRPILLSLGCGTGSDVDTLCDVGFECIGLSYTGTNCLLTPFVTG